MAEQQRYPIPDVSREREGRDSASAPENPLLIAHRLLRGRYPYAIALGVVLGVIGAAAGYLVIKPEYESRGIIQVAPTLPKVLYESEDSSVPPLFASFVSAQAEFVKTRRVFDLAIQDEQLRAVGWPDGADGVEKLAEAIAANVPKGGQVVLIRAKTGEPQSAQEAINAVLRAYKRLYIDERGRSRDERQQILEQRQGALQAELRSLRDQIANLSDQYGADNLPRLHAAKVDEIAGLETKIREADLLIAEAELRLRSTSPGASAAQAADGASVENPLSQPAELEVLRNALAAQDPTLASYLAQNQTLMRELASLESAGYGPQHRGVRELMNKSAALRTQIDDRVAYLQEHLSEGQPALATRDATASASLEQLQALRARYSRLRDEAQPQAEFFASRRRVITNLQDEADEKEGLLKETRTALEQTRVEMRQADETTGRVTIASWGDAPLSASSDKRLPAAATGFFGGLGAGVGLIAMFGLLNPCCRYVSDLERPTRSAPLLGTLPNLNASEAEQDEMAALSIHQIRNVLELQHFHPKGVGTIYTITSATAGEGKTSLTMSLGMSFAAADQRTLILDADLVGRGVTRQLRLEGEQGVRELMESASPHECSHATPVMNLSAMPTGSVKGFEPKNFSRERAARLIEQLRSSYDVVLIDTGPLLGSLEGNLLCALSDATILVVTRGQRSKMVQASLARIANIGGRCAGTVFNRALADDYVRSVSHASFQVASVRSSAEPEHGARNTRPAGSIAGSRALVQAVAGVYVAEPDEDHGDPSRA